MILALVLFAGTFLLSAILTAVVKRFSLRSGFVSRPQADRYNREVIPLGGGIAIFGTILFVMMMTTAAVHSTFVLRSFSFLGESVMVHADGFIAKTRQLVVIMLCMIVLFAVGLWDDKRGLGPFIKLFAQFAVAIAAAWFGEIRVEFFITNKIITTVLSATWIVLLINVFNFLDNMDGASAGIAIIVSGLIFTAAAFGGQVFVSGLAVFLIGALAGFLLFNFPPASIFMGDAGSLVVGFFVAVLTLRTTYYHGAVSGQWYTVLMPIIVLAVPLYDFISVTFLRIKQGRSPFVGDTQHFSHRLKAHGLSDRQTVLTLYLATLCSGLGATFLNQVGPGGAVLIFVQTFMILSIIAIFETTVRNESNGD